MSQTKGPLTREQVGQILFLLAKLCADEIRNGARNLENYAAAIQISPEELTNYLKMTASKVDSYVPRHDDPCPLCIIGTIKFQDHVRISEWPYEKWENQYKCTVCQAEFERERS